MQRTICIATAISIIDAIAVADVEALLGAIPPDGGMARPEPVQDPGAVQKVVHQGDDANRMIEGAGSTARLRRWCGLGGAMLNCRPGAHALQPHSKQ